MGRSKTKGKSGSTLARLALGLGVFVLVALVGAAAALYVHYRAYVARPVLKAGEMRTVVIPKGTPWPRVITLLEQAELVGYRHYFDLWARRQELPPRVKAGTYHLAGPMDLSALAAALEQGGAVEEVAVTIPEGWTIFDIADRLDATGLVGREAFLRAARDPAALAAAGVEAESFEGYLFPDTYRFRQGTSAEAIVDRLHDRWREIWEPLAAEHAASRQALGQAYGFDRHDFVTLASLVERETGAHGERGLIARVFLNRLDRDMRLQTDPTCVYGEDTYKDVPSPSACKDPLNRYSTYVIDGLPPGPIANPGRASLVAALDPPDGEEARSYLFFVARRDGSGGHHFSETFAEHKRAIRRFLK